MSVPLTNLTLPGNGCLSPKYGFAVPVKSIKLICDVKSNVDALAYCAFVNTNALLFNEDAWNQMKEIQPHIKVIEISIDAANKETYEKKTRINGQWDVLIENLKFLATQDNIIEEYNQKLKQKNFMIEDLKGKNEYLKAMND